MFLSECPEFDPDPRYRDHNLWLVAVCVSDFCDLHGVDQANEYFAAGQAKLAEFLDCVDKDAQIYRLTKPVRYVREAIKRAILLHWQTDRHLAIPPSTRRDMVKRGDTPPDHDRHSWDDVFDGNGLKSGPEERVGRYDLPNGRASGSVPNWSEGEEQWFEPESLFSQRSMVLESLETVYSLCRDELDRRIVEARFASIDDAPVHLDDVAAQIGISSYEVQERLNRLERRYYKLLDHAVPTKKRNQRPSLTV